MNKERGRKAGSTNTRPTKQAIDSYYLLLKSKAEAGCIEAMAALISLHEQRQAKPL